ncbi:MAG: DUF1553 domain-containing protein [Fuerstiella sp.]|nr:DUF1553 domain-containing protein [Fuerstiella sp.]MCP4856277.1 DUF1553 domain-containing protein [Fuerstiella sp.]
MVELLWIGAEFDLKRRMDDMYQHAESRQADRVTCRRNKRRSARSLRDLARGIVLSYLMTIAATAADLSQEQLDFFESRIRPVLVEYCYECHNSADATDGELVVDHRDALLNGGDGGPIIAPGQPAKSRLLAILRHDVEGLEMPQSGPKLDDRVIADFEKWIAEGAADPRDHAPSASELAAVTSWKSTLRRRKQWWSFQPIRNPVPPTVENQEWARHPIDRFVEAKRHAAGLTPSTPARPATLVRRLYFNLTGLSPGSQEAAEWTARIATASEQSRDDVVGQLVDELLTSPRFGERWARHWMDWIRYAESHGSEGDPEIAGAWVYRDYMIRALNADVPFDQLVREHVAGDLIQTPRINRDLGINESAIGPAHWRMVFHGFAPTDALDEKVRFIDDQINAFSKAFLGLTVSCARCHDHKFDAISQKDYYALFGILGSCRPGRSVIDLPDRVNRNRAALTALKPQIRSAIASEWETTLNTLTQRISDDDGPWMQAEKSDTVLHPVHRIQTATANGGNLADAWQQQVQSFEQQRASWQEQQARVALQRWNLADPSGYAEWFATGSGLPEQPHSAGEFAVSPTGDMALTGIYPAAVYSHALSAKHAARLTSDDLAIGEKTDLWVRVAGDAGATVRYAVHDYPRSGTVYPVTKLSNQWRWQRFDLAYWNGDDIHIELTTANDAPLLVANKPRSWFAVREALLLRKGEPSPSEFAEFLTPVFEAANGQPPSSMADIAAVYVTAIRTSINAWKNGTAADAQALLLDACVRQGLLANRLDAMPAVQPLISEYRRLEEQIPEPTRVPGLEETHARNQPLFERGNHKLPQEEVPRRFLEAIDANPYETSLSGRLELAEDILRNDNPLTRRVIVNRVWHHLFGRGIVSTPDNFGQLGDQPSHPELLDWLAARFVKEGWSLRKLIRHIVMTKTWQLSSSASQASRERDPDNRLLSHANVRRQEAEAIRDLLLTVSGRIEHRLAGPPVDGGSTRRSVYMRVRRNSLDPFLRAFDFPEPFTAVGRRDATNVPAQSLTMMNEPRTASYATAWANRILGNASLTSDDQRTSEMFLAAFGRPATATEVDRVRNYLATSRQRMEMQQRKLANLKTQIAERRGRIENITSPVRKQLLQEAKNDASRREADLPQPIGRWEFDESANDLVGAAESELRSGAHIQDGALIVSSGGHVVTRPLQQTLKAKTLEAWVQLDSLNQRGGGVITVQTRNGVMFDSIVFGERDPKQWLAGSNGFARTQAFNGPREQEATEQPVHVAIAYHPDGRIVGYRNGLPYGKPYKSSGPFEFKAGEAVVSFGIRHLPAGGNRMLAGRVMRAQIYDRALSAPEIAATSGVAPTFIPESRVLAALSPDDRAAVQHLSLSAKTLETELGALGPVPQTVSDAVLWSELAQALFTFKEFIYVR